MKLLITKSASKQLLKIPRNQRLKIEEKIEKLADFPTSLKTKKLTGRPGWCLRIGDYRVLYYLDKKKTSIIILSVKHRKDAYRS